MPGNRKGSPVRLPSLFNSKTMKRQKKYFLDLLKDKPLVTIYNARVGDKVSLLEVDKNGVFTKLITGVIMHPSYRELPHCIENPAITPEFAFGDRVYYTLIIKWDIEPVTIRSHHLELAFGANFASAVHNTTRLYKNISAISEDQKANVKNLADNLIKIGQ